MNIIIIFYFNGPALGVAVYAKELLHELIPKLAPHSTKIEVRCSTDAYNYLVEDTSISKYCTEKKELNRGISRIYYLFKLPFICLRNSKVINLSNPFTPPFSKLSKTSIVSVIHDLNEFESLRKYGPIRSFIRRMLLRFAIYNSHQIICISNHSKKQVSDYFPKIKNISVINNGAGCSLPQKRRKPEKIVLVVGRLDPIGKNLWPTIEFFDRWHTEDPELRIIFTGGISISSEKDANLFLCELSKRAFIEYVGRSSDEELSTLYSKAEFLLFFSVSEGFGLPAFEALRLDCPVVAHRDNSALLELLPTQLIYTNENEKLDLVKIRYLISKMDWDSSKKIASEYTWEKSAHGYADAILRCP